MSRADQLFGWDASSDEIRSELVEQRHRSTRKPVIFANILVAAVIAAFLWETKSHALLLGWLAAIALVALLLSWSMAYYTRHKRARSPQHWAVRFSLGGLLNGIAWGGGALLLFDPATPDSNILMIGVMCGMTAANIVTSFAVPLSAYSYLVPAIAFSMYMPLTQGSAAEQTLALLWLPYLAIMVMLTRSAHRGLAESIRLNYENTRLAEHLTVAKERAEHLARAKSDFLAVMSHEIRTPMHGMLGVAELLAGTNLDAKQKIYLSHLRGSGEYLAQLLNNILDYSKIEAEKLVLNEGTFSLAELVGEVASLFAVQATRKGLVLNTSFPDDVAPYWRGDAHRIKQVLINLLGNAYKFTDTGSIKLAITSAEEAGDKRCLHFRVTDSGAGIASHLIDTIFDPFTQERASTSQQYGGTGLGLAISKRLVEAMGGKLDVDSRVGIGSTFSFTLWLTPVDSTELPAVSEPLPNDSAVLPQARILLADDSPFNRLVVREFLRETACTVDEVENGLDAVQRFQQTGHEIVLMDMRMPQMSGIEAVRRIRLWEAEQQRKPALIIMLTASAFESDRVAVLASGCDEVLTKPVQKSTLIRLLHKNTKNKLAASA